jgi:uncharacterized membrane protein YhaH (DUF805 family)
MSWFLMAWSRAADFSGRSRRSEYWYFQLFNFFVGIVVCILGYLFSSPGSIGNLVTFCGIYSLVSFVPSLSVTVRRLHDTGRSGWWYCIGFIPLLGAIILLVFMVTDSDPGWNEYGHSPKSAEYLQNVI